MNRFQKHYETIVTYDLLFKDHFINVMQLPKLDHITLNTGIGLKAILDKKQIMSALLGLEFISNQRPIITRAKKSIDKFKLREKMAIGCKVTLRKHNLYGFMDRFINAALPSLDNSHELFNSAYFKNYSLKRSRLIANKRDLITLLLSDRSEQSNKFTKKILNDGDLNPSRNSVKLPYFKWTHGVFAECSKDLRTKLWLSQHPAPIGSGLLCWGRSTLKKRSLFLPCGKDYVFLSLNNTQKNFLLSYNFNTLFTKRTSPSVRINKPRSQDPKTLNKMSSLKQVRYSVALGLKDFISSTWLRNFGSNCGDIEASHGIDIIFVTRLLKNNTLNLSKPQYFLSNFQMPF